MRTNKIIEPTIRFDWTRCENLGMLNLFDTFMRVAMEQNCPPQVLQKIFEVAFQKDYNHFLQVLLDNTN